MEVADARAEMRRTLELATKGSGVLTTDGKPEAAVVSFTRSKTCGAHYCMCLWPRWITLARSQERLRSRLEEVQFPTEKEIESLVGESLDKARRSGKFSRRTSRS